jgi:hypothetical protein
MNKSFKELKDREEAAMLLLKLIKKTEGLLSKEECLNIVQQLKNVEIDDIKVIRDAKAFAKIITIEQDIFEHSWAGRKEYIESGQVLIGNNINFGKDRSYIYSFNGDIKEDVQEKEDPDFNINEKYVILKEITDRSNYNNDYRDYFTRNVYVYYPEEEPYKVDPEVKYILDNFIGL